MRQELLDVLFVYKQQLTTAAYRQFNFEGSFSAKSTNTWCISLAAGTVRGVLPLREEVLIPIIYRKKKISKSSLWAFWQFSCVDVIWFSDSRHSRIHFFSEFFWSTFGDNVVLVRMSVHMFSVARMPGSKGSYQQHNFGQIAYLFCVCFLICKMDIMISILPYREFLCMGDNQVRTPEKT